MLTAKEHVVRRGGRESYPFTDNTTRLLDALYSGPLRRLSVERIVVYSSSLGGFLSYPCDS